RGRPAGGSCDLSVHRAPADLRKGTSRASCAGAGSALRPRGAGGRGAPGARPAPRDLCVVRGAGPLPGRPAPGRGGGLCPRRAGGAGGGMRLLLMEQPSLPGPLREDLRLWPSFTRPRGSSALVAWRHPVRRGLASVDAPAGTTPVAFPFRPLLPPTRGNFTV